MKWFPHPDASNSANCVDPLSSAIRYPLRWTHFPLDRAAALALSCSHAALNPQSFVMPPVQPASSARPPVPPAQSIPSWMAIPSIHVSSTPTRWKVLEELRELLGDLDEQVVAQWQTHNLLQRRDAELEHRAQAQQAKQSEQQEGEQENRKAGRTDQQETETNRVNSIGVEEDDTATTNGHNGIVHQRTETKRKERERRNRHRDTQPSSTQETDGEQQPNASESMVEQHERKKEKKRKREHHDGTDQLLQQQVSSSESAVNIMPPLAEINIDSPAAPPQRQPTLPANGMQEIEITIDDEPDNLPSVPPSPPPAASRQPSPLPPPSPAPLSRLSLLSVLTFLLPARDPASYASWSIDTLVQRVQAEYTSQLYELCLPTELSTELLFSFAHLLSPLILPSGRVVPVYVDGEVCRLVREVAAHVMAAIEGSTEGADNNDDEDDEESAVPVDEARLALSEVVRVSEMIGMSEADIGAIQRWLQSVTPAVKPLAVPVRASPINSGIHPLSTSSPSPSPSRASTSFSSSSAPSPSSSSSSSSVQPASTVPVSLTAAVAAAKPRFIVLDGANIGRWSGSGDPSTEVTVTTTTSRPSHLQHLPSTDSRTMSRFASWQLVAAVHAVEQLLNVPALICLPEQFIRRPERFAVQDSDLLLLLQKQGKLHRLPTGADDDSQLIRMAESGNTWIVTNDNFRDHVYSGRVSKQWVDERVIKFYTIEFPRVGAGGVGGGGVRTEEEVREKGQVCLVDPSVLRRNMHAKEEMERERERDEAETAAATRQHPSPTLAGSWYDGQQYVSKTGYPSILSFPLHPPPPPPPNQTQYLPHPPPSGEVGFPPHSFGPPPDLYMPYPPPPPFSHSPTYAPAAPYWPAAPPAGHNGMSYTVPAGYPPPPPSYPSQAAAARPSSTAPPIYPPGALRPEHFRSLKRS